MYIYNQKERFCYAYNIKWPCNPNSKLDILTIIQERQLSFYMARKIEFERKTAKCGRITAKQNGSIVYARYSSSNCVHVQGQISMGITVKVFKKQEYGRQITFV